MAKDSGSKKEPAAKKKAASKSEVFAALVEKTGLSKKQVSAFFDSLTDVMKEHLVGKKGPGIFQLPGLFKVTVVRKPATKDGMKMNPFTKQMVMVKGKPARNTVRVRPLKMLKDLVA